MRTCRGRSELLCSIPHHKWPSPPLRPMITAEINSQREEEIESTKPPIPSKRTDHFHAFVRRQVRRQKYPRWRSPLWLCHLCYNIPWALRLRHNESSISEAMKPKRCRDTNTAHSDHSDQRITPFLLDRRQTFCKSIGITTQHAKGPG